jgi:Uma2 family endonuclease
MTGALREPLPHMTADQFLDWDGGGHQGKLELVNGEVVAMSPASGTHSIIQANVTVLIGLHLRAKKMQCRVGTEAPVIPRLSANDNVRAPDIAVTRSDKITGKTFPDPVLIVEVLSPSNQRETWESIHACATIPTLMEIAVIDSERCHAQVFRRDEQGVWPKDGDIVENDGVLKLTTIDAEFPVSEIYAGTHLG